MMFEPSLGVRLNHHSLYGKLPPSRPPNDGFRDLARCSFGRVMVSERVSPGRMGKSPESRYPEQDRFHTIPCPWTRPAWCVDGAAHREAPLGTNREGHRGLAGEAHYRREANDGARV